MSVHLTDMKESVPQRLKSAEAAFTPQTSWLSGELMNDSLKYERASDIMA